MFGIGKLVEKWFDIVFVLVLTYLVLSNPRGFSMAVRSAGSVHNSAIRTLQGR